MAPDEGNLTPKRPVLYHGSPVRGLRTLHTPTRLSAWDVTRGGVIYLTSDEKVAHRYAGPAGSVYVVSAPAARTYREQRRLQRLPKKSAKYVRDVYVALAEECEIKTEISTDE